jgi:hypothetical protein
MMKICYQKNRKGAAGEQKDAKINCGFKKKIVQKCKRWKKKV